MKTTLRQQKDLVEIIQTSSMIVGVKTLREFLKNNGYEDPGDCKHYAIVRITGKCMNCGTVVAEPIVLGSEESLQALRERLRG